MGRRSGAAAIAIKAWAEADTPVSDCRGSFRRQSGDPNLTAARQLMTDTVEKVDFFE
jgi:hypothetical protein